MKNEKLPEFLNNPKREACAREFSALAETLRKEAFSVEQIAAAAQGTADHYAYQAGFDAFRRFTLWMQAYATVNLENTGIDDVFDGALHEAKEERFEKRRRDWVEYQKDQCAGRFASLALKMENCGFSEQHIAYAAQDVANEQLRALGPGPYYNHLRHWVRSSDYSLRQLDALAAGLPADEIPYYS